MSIEVELIEAFVEKIKDDFFTGEFITKDNEDYKQYNVLQQDAYYEAYLTDTELEEVVRASIDIVEELMRINQEGFDRKAFDAAWDELEKENHKFSYTLKQIAYVNKHFHTERLKEIKEKLSEIRRVGGAYEMFVSNPILDQTLYVVYASSVDAWEENDMDLRSVYFLIRSIMRLNSRELNEIYQKEGV